LQSSGTAFAQSVASAARAAGTGVPVGAISFQVPLSPSPVFGPATTLSPGLPPAAVEVAHKMVRRTVCCATPLPLNSAVRAQALAAAALSVPVEVARVTPVAGSERPEQAPTAERLGGAAGRVDRALSEAARWGAPAAEPEVPGPRRATLSSVLTHLTQSRVHHVLKPSRGGGRDPREAERSRALGKVIGVGLAFAAIEAAGAFFTGSVALRADAMHLLLDTAVSAGALFALWLAKRPGNRFPKAEPVIGLISSILIGLTAIEIGHEAYLRFLSPVEVSPATMFLALSGLAANVINALLLRKFSDDGLSTKSAFLHALTDAVGSIGIILSGLAVYFLHWVWADAAIAGVIVSLIVATAGNLARASWKSLRSKT
ncbi:MAG: cation diffusion facilitator family transporter, partial [Elusimicrobia bacterium]|nr:cation diffusion facilitator family transporter [Elusimicrobiota bacterium]